MTRRTALWAAGAALVACKRRETVRMEPVDESSPGFASTVHMADPSTTHQLVSGFHPVEQNAWRWTEGAFVVMVAVPPAAAASGALLTLQFSVPEPVVNRLGALTLTATVGERVVGRSRYGSAGEARFEAELPAELLKDEAISVKFTLDKFLASGTVDERELGLVVSALTLAPL